MASTVSKIQTQKFLLSSLVAVGLPIVFVTFLHRESLGLVTDFAYITVTSALVTLSLVLSLRFRKTGSHGKAWLFFLCTAISWCVAETTWSVYELVYHLNPFPSLADVFYLGGYPFLFFFLIYYMRPVRKDISRKMIIGAALLSSSMMVPSIYMAYDFDPKVNLFENLLATSYPVADAIVFIPAIIGVILFFRGEVNFTWSLICIAIILLTIGDTGFQLTSFNNTYYTGHPVDIVFLWSYVVFAFGVYDHIQLFKKERIWKNSKTGMD